jgi:hypothetical protein
MISVGLADGTWCELGWECDVAEMGVLGGADIDGPPQGESGESGNMDDGDVEW